MQGQICKETKLKWLFLLFSKLRESVLQKTLIFSGFQSDLWHLSRLHLLVALRCRMQPLSFPLPLFASNILARSLKIPNPLLHLTLIPPFTRFRPTAPFDSGSASQTQETAVRGAESESESEVAGGENSVLRRKLMISLLTQSYANCSYWMPRIPQRTSGSSSIPMEDH